MKLENIVKSIAAVTVAVGLAASAPVYGKSKLERSSKNHKREKLGLCMEAIWKEVHPYVIQGCKAIQSKSKYCVNQTEQKCIGKLDGGNPKISQHMYSVCVGKVLSKRSKKTGVNAQVTIQAPPAYKRRDCR